MCVVCDSKSLCRFVAQVVHIMALQTLNLNFLNFSGVISSNRDRPHYFQG